MTGIFLPNTTRAPVSRIRNFWAIGSGYTFSKLGGSRSEIKKYIYHDFFDQLRTVLRIKTVIVIKINMTCKNIENVRIFWHFISDPHFSERVGSGSATLPRALLVITWKLCNFVFAKFILALHSTVQNFTQSTKFWLETYSCIWCCCCCCLTVCKPGLEKNLD